MQFSIRVRHGKLKTPTFVIADEKRLSTPKGRAAAIEEVVAKAKMYFEQLNHRKTSPAFKKDGTVWPPTNVESYASEEHAVQSTDGVEFRRHQC
ncbi:MAG: hypothetical protein WAN12_20465 [Candidatus Acidiferrum sp.]